MRIVLDLQGAQSASRLRGIGRYSLSFAQALVRNNAGHDIIIALSALFPETIQPIRRAFDNLLPAGNIVVWDAPGPVAAIDPSNAERRDLAELVREAFLASLNPDIVHVTSLFEGYIDDAVTSIARHGAGCPVSVTLYDLIPLLNADRFLDPDPRYAEYYRQKIGYLKKASLLLAISRSAASEAVDHLGRDEAQVIPVGTGSDGHFRKTELRPVERDAVLASMGLYHPFFLYVSAPAVHKNHKRLIEAFARLPASVRDTHQLAFVGHFSIFDRQDFETHAARSGLRPGSLVLLDAVSDSDLNTLYNLSQGFIMPSWHEGFGLPAVEAMLCGRATIGSRASSLPEVIGRDDALFDPFDVDDMCRVIHRLATDDEWRRELEAHAAVQSRLFTWDNVARKTFQAFESLRPAAGSGVAPDPLPQRKRRLAFVSPLPPERSGISDYSADLLPALARHYDIDLISSQALVGAEIAGGAMPVRSVDWFHDHAGEFDRIVYQFGNSPLHAHMVDLLEQFPGVVVLHDFYLSSLQAYRAGHDQRKLFDALRRDHGIAVACDWIAGGDGAAVETYPLNLQILQDALGIIVHSEHSKALADHWYGDTSSAGWNVIPLVRTPVVDASRDEARTQLGLGEDDLLVCSFGFLDPTKLNHRLLEAWLDSPVASRPGARLVFVGENHGAAYGRALLDRIAQAGAREAVQITGWGDRPLFQTYLAAADIAVQLRANTRGETSASVLDCMNHGIPTIVNAHGTMAELDSSAVWMLPDEFSQAELLDALNTLAKDVHRRRLIGDRARSVIREKHAPAICAALYEQAIEATYEQAGRGLHGLIRSLKERRISPGESSRLATSLARDFPEHPRRPQLLIDVSTLARTDLRTGIERVVRAVLREWLINSPSGWQVEPVYATTDMPGYRYARRFTCRFLGQPDDGIEDSVVEAWPGDVFFGLDFAPDTVAAQQDHLQAWQNRGVTTWFIVYDLLPILMPHVFPPAADDGHERWLRKVSQFDGNVCISKAVADELKRWRETALVEAAPQRIEWFHLGADIQRSAPTTGFPDGAERILSTIRGRPTFLMVGTIEPRKGYLQTIAAFELLWAKGVDVNLVIVGQEGWKPVPDIQRRTIPRIVSTLRQHPERGERLFWLDGISDEYLEAIYEASSCLIAASEGEGFGLPLIEAAQHGLPVLARDIPVFREVAGEHATYFSGLDAADLAEAVLGWLEDAQRERIPDPTSITWHTWQEAARRIARHLGVITEE
ncbi:glycosyltransferase [Acidiphilium sp. JA12-A1]|uniref:glycosyltransferase n=1 Tax=Acidiphilium sp. JA12-A1 TaxID=1464546 RepID=UPI00046169FA|nr:glycosyltransferase [Acidiphilium sp. JA12-A1]KDM66912.1 glycosyl transferase, group 1 [Acidiphilium sp. JA12-A1]